MKLAQLMNQNYDRLNENDKILLAAILSEPQEFSKLSCAQISERCHISRATLLRALRKLGLTSFSDLKLALKEDGSSGQEIDINFDAVCDIYHRLIDELNEFSYFHICEMFYESDVIYIYGTGNEQKTLAEEFKRIFLSAGKCVVDLFDFGEIDFMKTAFRESDVFVVISLSGETKAGIEILNLVLPTGVRTLSITRLQNNTISRMCEANLYVATQMVQSQMSYELVSGFYMLLDMLFLNYLEYMKEAQDED